MNVMHMEQHFFFSEYTEEGCQTWLKYSLKYSNLLLKYSCARFITPSWTNQVIQGGSQGVEDPTKDPRGEIKTPAKQIIRRTLQRKKTRKR